MKNLAIIFMSIMTLTACFPVDALEDPEKHEMPPYYEGSVELQKMKSLVGDWKGTHKMGEESSEAFANYKVTSNGSAVVETIFPGTPMEMISVYYDEGDTMTMVHYCSLANQPKMDFVKSKDNTIMMDFSKDNTLNPQTDMHMHSLTITLKDENNIVQNWTSYNKGEAQGTSVIKLSRIEGK